MEMRNFGGTGMLVSPVTFGAWSIGGPAQISGIQVGWSGVDDKTSIRAVEAAFDSGINLYDTADSYANGHSEALLGQALSGKRDKVYLSTKVGLIDTADTKFHLDFSDKHIRESCEGSLKRLRTDYIDIYLLHMVADGYPLTEEIRGVLDSLKQAGKIRHYGVSVQFAQQGAEQLSQGFGEAMMIEHNMLTGSEVKAVMAAAGEKGTGVITRGALAKGLLTGKYKAGHRFAADDVRSRLDGAAIDEILEKVDRLAQYLRETGGDLLSMALAYQLRQAGCSTVTVGLKTPEQVAEMVGAAAHQAEYDWNEIERIMGEKI